MSAQVFAVSLNLDQPATGGPVGEAREGWMQAGDHQRGHAGAQGIHECMCAYAPREHDVYACTSDLLPRPVQAEGT